jgi:hypothetical protein
MQHSQTYADLPERKYLLALYRHIMNSFMHLATDKAGTGEPALNPNPENESAPSVNQNTNRYIRCPDCGEQILMMPNLSEMIEAIETHLSTHSAHERLNPVVKHLREPVIEESLAEQVLMTAADIRETPSKNPWINLP